MSSIQLDLGEIGDLKPQGPGQQESTSPKSMSQIPILELALQAYIVCSSLTGWCWNSVAVCMTWSYTVKAIPLESCCLHQHDL